jgi:hypothetical protein
MNRSANFPIYEPESSGYIRPRSFCLLSSSWFTPGQSLEKHLKIMAKKIDSILKPAAPLKVVASTKPAGITPPANGSAPAPEKAAAPLKRAVKPAAKKAPAKTTKAPATKARGSTKTVARATSKYTRDDVALRAYFISEKRRAHGIHGNEHQDWLEAERQLAAESPRPKRAKKV